MTQELLNIILGLIAFILFTFIQALIINGYKDSLGEGMILSWFSKFIERNIKNEYWRKPLISCVKCMSSVIGGILYWFFVLVCFGWHWQEIPIFVADIFTLVTLNWWIYKRL